MGSRVMNFEPVNKANYLRRRAVSAIMDSLCLLAAILGLVVLALIMYTLVSEGIAGLSLDAFFLPTRAPGQPGGLANAIVGSLIQTGLGIAMGAPLGLAAGIYLAEVGRDHRFASVVRFVNDILLSAPSILVGLFVYQIVVSPMHSFSALAGSIALALIAMPIVARTTEDIIKLVPHTFREGSLALGARESTTIARVIVPAAFNGILTAILLAVARIAGETAPLIFTSLGSNIWSFDLTEPMASLPITIYRYAASPYADWTQLAWTGALIITVGVLALNIASRWALAHSTRAR